MDITVDAESTTVEIILYYLTLKSLHNLELSTTVEIILYYLTYQSRTRGKTIYNSRNYSILLNEKIKDCDKLSTTVEIILYYLTRFIESEDLYLQQ